MLVFRKILCALFSCYTRFKIRPFVSLSTKWVNKFSRKITKIWVQWEIVYKITQEMIAKLSILKYFEIFCIKCKFYIKCTLHPDSKNSKSNLPTNCLSVFDHFVILAFKWLKLSKHCEMRLSIIDPRFFVILGLEMKGLR